MLTFFRRIRHGLLRQIQPKESLLPEEQIRDGESAAFTERLLEGGAMSRYALYAIGEITLVVIGILIALQINNWNENRKDRKIEQEYLIGLKEEFEYNLQELDDNIALNENVMRATRDFLKDTGPSTQVSDIGTIRQHVDNIMSQAIGVEPSPGVLEDLINSGNLNTLKNKELRSALSGWKSVLRKVERQETRVLDYREGIAHIFMKDGPFRNIVDHRLHVGTSKFELSGQKVLQNHQLENQLVVFMVTSNALQISYYVEMKNSIDDILDLIDESIK